MDEVLYPLDKLPFTAKEFHSKFTYLSEPLSLFDDARDDADVGNENPDVPRPLTPVEEALKVPPSSFSALMTVLGPRLKAQEGITGLPVADQQVFIDILINELSNVWYEVRTIAPDPLLTQTQNRELQRRLAVEVILIVQDLFNQYVTKSHELNERGVFSGPANFTRLRAQLALDAHKSLNVLSIRRKLATEMKQPDEYRSCLSSEYSKLMSSQNVTRAGLAESQKITYGSGRPFKRAGIKLTKEERRLQREVVDLQQKMPDIDMDKLNFFIPPDVESEDDEEESDLDTLIENESILSEKEEEDGPRHRLFRSHSVPEPKGETLFEEYGIIKETEAMLKRPPSLIHFRKKISDEEEATPVKESSPLPGTKEYAKMDLQNLIAGTGKNSVEPENENDSEILPPLIQAIARHQKKEKKTIQTKGMESRASSVLEDGVGDDGVSDISTIISTTDSATAINPEITDTRTMDGSFGEQEHHPQPSVVTTRVPNKGIVRTSDVRVSNRVNKSSVTLKKNPPVYNEILGEIDPVALKWLDRNLYVGQEIKEVYDEISKTIKKDHLLYDQDDFVEACPTKLHLHDVVPSSTLTGRKSQRVINKGLHQDILPPWGMNDEMTWRNNPKFSGMGREDILELGPEKIGKPYLSWMSWWRSVITSDDYLKYITTQDNDYLSLVFHLYESDGSDSEDEEEGGKASADAMRILYLQERENTLKELRTQKETFRPGLWNANSVLLGGLGRDPEIDEEEIAARVTSSKLSANKEFTPSRGPSQKSKSYLSSRASEVVSHTGRSQGFDRSPVPSHDKALSLTPRGKSADPGRDTQSRRSGKSTLTSATTTTASQDNVYSTQERLERVWTLLCMPDQYKMDMAIKYSTDPYTGILDEAIVCWEAATQAILERENLITKLEDFERTASDPNRFFEKGYQGSSAARLMESRVRSWFQKRLTEVGNSIKEIITEISQRFGDNVTFQGRPYIEKMSSDCTEMLFWLQQERRQQLIDRSADAKSFLSLKTAELQPLTADVAL